MGSNIARLTNSQFKVYATYNSYPCEIPGCEFVRLDITDREQVLALLREINPNLVIHAAALTNVDYCEEHPLEAWTINVEGTENVVLASKEVGAKVLYISTDSVFDGKEGMYAEEDAPHPLNIYAKTKLEGEQRVLHWLLDSIIVRTAFYGWSLRGDRSLAEWVVNNLRDGKPLKMFTDIFFSPIFVSNLTEALIEIYHLDLAGVYHVAGRERCSKYHFGQEVARAFEMSGSYIQPCSIKEVGLKAPRPRDVSLGISQVSGKIKTRLLDVREGIERFKEAEL